MTKPNPFLLRQLFYITIVILITACSNNQNTKDNNYPWLVNDNNLDSCLGMENSELLGGIVEVFDYFLINNRFASHEEELLDGYKSYLKYILNNAMPDSNWIHDIDQYKELISKIENSTLMDELYGGKLPDCIKTMEYPDTFFMNSYLEIMPQHNVSPSVCAGEFLDEVNEEEFTDPVIRKMIALEYFLGTIINNIRPDSLYFSEGDSEL